MAGEAPHFLIYIFAFVLLIGTLVVVHELGHYLVGRYFGVKAEKFSVGFGPQIWGRVDKRGTLWRIGALPLGGYVQFAGDMSPASQPDPDYLKLSEAQRNETFQSKALWQKSLIVFAGPAVNFLLAIAIFMGLLLAYGQSYTPPVADQIVENSAAAEAGLQPGDSFVSFNGEQIESFEELVNEVIMIPNETVPMVIDRGGQQIAKEIRVAEREEIDRFGNMYRIGQIGVAGTERAVREISLIESPWLAVQQTGSIVKQQIRGIGQIISGRRSVKELGGPLKIAKISGEVFTLGLVSFISLAALISINLGFINLLPIPMLDGGHLLLYGIEAVRRRPTSPKVQEWAFRTGFAAVVAFMLLVTFNDLDSFGLFG